MSTYRRLKNSEDMTILKTATVKLYSQDKVFGEFISDATKGMADCTQYLIDHLPLDTPVLRALSAIDPEILPKQEAISYIKQLPALVNVLTDEEQDTYNRELIRFSQSKLPRKTSPMR